MIVDDEKAIRDSLPAVIDFEEVGFRVCQTARNGQDALEKIQEEHPDVLLLDIRMPILDGLGLLKALEEQMKDYHPLVIMLSGYSDFEYARTAIRYGVKAYLTKPLDEDELLDELGKLKNELDESHAHRANVMLKSQADKVKGLLYAEKPGIREQMKGIFLLHCVILKENEEKDQYERTRSCIERELDDEQLVFLRGRGCVLTYLAEESCLKEYQSNPRLFGRHLLHKMKQEGLSCAILLDNQIFEPSTNSFRSDYDSHLYALMTRVFWNEENLVCNLVSSESVQFLDQEKEGFDAIRTALAQNDRKIAVLWMEKMIEQAVDRQLNIVMIQELNYRFYYLLQDLIQKKKTATPIEITAMDWRESTRYLCHKEWETTLRSQFLQVVDCLTEERVDEQSTAYQILVYINTHFREPISAKDIASQFFISSGYLGKVIQQASGETFKQYLNRLRMEEAKRLLLSSNQLVYEIAEEVGFNDSKYFISRFTEEVGMTPAEYRKKNESK